MSRTAWIWTVAGTGLAALLAWAWIDGGEREPRWIEQPVAAPPEG